MEAAFERLVHRYLETTAEDNPTFGTFLGLHSYDRELGGFSQEAFQQRRDHAREILAALDGMDLDGASVDTRIDAAVLRATLARTIFEHDRLRVHELEPAVYVRTAIGGCYQLVIRDFAPLVERAASLLARLKQVPRVLASAERNVKEPPAVFARVGAEAAAGGAAFLRSVIPGVAEKAPGLARDLERAAGSAVEALDSAAAHFAKLEEEATTPFHVGRENYEWLLREAHLLDLDSDQLLEVGQEALRETKAAMADVGQEIDPDRSWAEILEELKSEHPSKEGLKAYYAAEMERARDFVLKNDLVSVPAGESLEVIDTPVFIRTTIPYAAYMPPGPFETDQRGFFYVTPVDERLSPDEQERQLRGHGIHAITVVALHEAYPGHHLQLVTANAGPRLIRRLTWNTVFVEGWALYCEEMMKEAGFYPDPRARLSQLKETLWRAARVVVDVGLARGEMSIDEAIDFMMDEVMLEHINATAEVKRYAGSPTQPSSYLIGKRAIMSIRRRWERARGSSFDLKEFHDALLGVGSIPPRLVEAALDLDGAQAS